MFVQKLNILTGEAEWSYVEDAGAGGEDDASADLVASSSYLDMLTDKRRNLAYEVAVDRVLARLKQTWQNAHQDLGVSPAPQVLDIGTGTGLLAMMAARAVQSQFHSTHSSCGTISQLSPPVIACEVFPPMAAVAKRVVASNGLQDAIAIIHKRSDELSVVCTAGNTSSSQQTATPAAQAQPDMPGLADVVVSEILDSELLGEGVLPTMRQAAAQLMKADAVAIPASATLWAQLVECPVLWRMSTLDNTEAQPAYASTPGHPHTSTLKSAVQQVLDVLRLLDGRAHQAAVQQAGQSMAWQQLHELHVDALYTTGQLQLLSQPFPLMHLNLTRPPASNPEQGMDVQVQVTGGGKLHALVYWWQLYLDEQVPPVVLSTAPAWVGSDVAAGGDGGPLNGVSQQWRDHWKQCWAPLGTTQPAQVQPGDLVCISVTHGDVNVRVALQSINSTRDTPHVKQPTSEPDVTPCILSPLRQWLAPHLMAQLHMISGWAAYADAIHAAIQTQPSLDKVFVLGNSLMLPLLSAVLLKATPVGDAARHCSICVLMEGEAEKRWIAAGMEQLGAMDMVEFVKPGPFMKRLRHAARQPPVACAADSSHPRVLVVSELRFVETEGCLPWLPLLRFWSDVQCLKRSGHLVTCIPSHATLRGVLVSLPELWRTRCCLDKVAGFDLRAANGVLGCVHPQAFTRPQESASPQPRKHLGPLSAPLWQCGPGCKELSLRVDLLHVDVNQSMESAVHGQADLQLSSSAATGERAHALVVWVQVDHVHGGPPDQQAGHQGLFLLHEPLTAGQALRVSVQLDANAGDMLFALSS